MSYHNAVTNSELGDVRRSCINFLFKKINELCVELCVVIFGQIPVVTEYFTAVFVKSFTLVNYTSNWSSHRWEIIDGMVVAKNR